MFKHLKNFLIAIVLTFSFMSNINALTYNYTNTDDGYNFHGLNLNQKLIDDIWNNLNGKTFNEVLEGNIGASGDVPFLKENFPFVIAEWTGTTVVLHLIPSKIFNYRSSPLDYFVEPSPEQSYSGSYPRIEFNQSNKTYYINYDNFPRIEPNKSNYFVASFDYINGNGETIYSKVFDYDSNPIPTIFNFHLNGGHGTCVLGIDPPTPVIPILHDDENFSISTDDYDIYDVLDNLEIEKDNMIFDGFYYDSNFTQPFNINDNFDEHATVENDAKVINLYAKYRYKTVDDFLANTDFTTYTFDTNYDYAIINRGNNSDIVYMGLPFNSYNLEVYEYQENTGTYKNGSSVCLVPIFNKGGWYMYELNTLFTNNQEVLIIPRYLFDELDPNSFEDPSEQYNFYLTQNAYVTYTNDLTHVTITNSHGQTVDTNLQNSFELSQQYQEMYAHEKDIYAQIKIFLNNLTRYTTAIRQLFEYLFNSLNSTIRNFIIFIVVIILLSAILRTIRRG